MAEAKTTWERFMEEREKLFPRRRALDRVRPPEDGALAIMFLCDELDKAHKRIAELERNLAEVAMGGRRG